MYCSGHYKVHLCDWIPSRTRVLARVLVSKAGLPLCRACSKPREPRRRYSRHLSRVMNQSRIKLRPSGILELKAELVMEQLLLVLANAVSYTFKSH